MDVSARETHIRLWIPTVQIVRVFTALNKVLMHVHVHVHVQDTTVAQGVLAQ